MLSPTQVEQQLGPTPAQSPPLTESLKSTMKSSKMDNRGNCSEHHTQNILTLPPEFSTSLKRDPNFYSTKASASSKHSIYLDEQSQKLVVVEIASGDIVHTSKTLTSFVSMSPYEPTLILSNSSREVVANLQQKTQKLYDDPNPAENSTRPLAEVCLWLDRSKFIFASQKGVFIWEMNVQDQLPELLFKIPDAEKYICIGISATPGCQSLVINLREIEKDTTCSYYWVKKNATGQMINHSCVALFPSIDAQECDLVTSIRTVNSKMMVIMRSRKPEGGSVPHLDANLDLPLENSQDKPLAMFKCPKRTLVYLITLYGKVYVADLHLKSFFANYKLLDVAEGEKLVYAYPNPASEGFITLDTAGRFYESKMDVSFTEKMFSENIQDEDYLKALFVNGQYLSSAANFLEPRLREYLDSKHIEEAVEYVLNSPQQILRSERTMTLLSDYSDTTKKQSSLLHYVNAVRKRGKFNQEECLWLVKASKKVPQFMKIINKLIEEERFHHSEEVGDEIFRLGEENVDLCLTVYVRSSSYYKVCGCFCVKKDTDNLQEYMARCLHKDANLVTVLKNLKSFDSTMLKSVVEFALRSGANDENMKKQIVPMDIMAVFDAIRESQLLVDMIPLLLEKINDQDSENKVSIDEKDIFDALVEKDCLLAIKLAQDGELFKNIDFDTLKRSISSSSYPFASMLFETNHYELKRQIMQCESSIPIEVLEYITKNRSVHEIVEIIEVLLQTENKAKIQAASAILKSHKNSLPMKQISEIYTFNGQQTLLFDILKSMALTATEIEETTTLYAELCLSLAKMPDLEHLIRNQKHLDAIAIANLLTSHTPFQANHFIILCDKHDMIEKMVHQLVHVNQNQYLELFAQKINPKRMPEVVAALIKLDISDEQLKSMINGANLQYSFVKLFKVLDEANKLEMVKIILEQQVSRDSKDPEVYTALAMLNVKMNNNAEQFITTNKLFDPKIVGDFCINYNSKLACLAYQIGDMDSDLLACAEKYQHFDIIASYCLQRNTSDLWNKILNKYFDENVNISVLPIQEQFFKEILRTVGQCSDVHRVKSFINCISALKDQNNLTKALHYLIIDVPSSAIASNEEYQTLLIRLSCEHQPSQTMTYIKKLKNYDTELIRDKLIKNKLYEEAFEMLKNHNKECEAMDVLLNYINNIDRARLYASSVYDSAAISALATKLLELGDFEQAIKHFSQAKNFTAFSSIIRSGMDGKNYAQLLAYLQSARDFVSDPLIDTYTAVMFALLDMTSEIHSLLASENNCEVLKAGEICLEHEKYRAAEILFLACFNYSKLALVSMYMGDLKKAIKYGDSANSQSVWYDICIECIEKKEIQGIEYASGKLFASNYKVLEIVEKFEIRGLFNLLCRCLENATNQLQAQPSIYQCYIIALAKYSSHSLSQAILMWHSKIPNKSEVVKALISTANYQEAATLEELAGNYDLAIEIMLDYPAQAFQHSKILQLAPKLSQTSTVDALIHFYTQYRADMVADIYHALLSKQSHEHLLAQLGKENQILVLDALEEKYMHLNDQDINNALITSYNETKNFRKLKNLLASNNNYDSSLIFKEVSQEFADIAAISLRQSKKFHEAFAVAKKYNITTDILNIIHECHEKDLIEEIIDWLISFEDKAYFLAALVMSFEMISASRLEIWAWKHNCEHLVKPFSIAKLQKLEEKLNLLEIKSGAVNGNASPSPKKVNKTFNGKYYLN